jgi:hypothetical protein
VAKTARGVPITGPVSRSGLWLIGGTLLLSVVVLAWAFQDEPAGSSTSGTRRVATVRPSSTRPAAVRIEPSASDPLAGAPSVAEYGPLLQRNVFRPLVTPKASGPGRITTARRRGSSDERSGSRRVADASSGEASAPGTPDAWRGWQFNGVAHLDQKTYALMDQPNRKQSRFVKPGDKLEDAIVARVADDEVTLREAGGEIVRVQRVDAMAALLRPSRSGTRSPRNPAAPSAAPAPAIPCARSGPVVTTPQNLETPRGVLPTSSAPEERREARRALRQQRREAGRLEAGENPAVSED